MAYEKRVAVLKQVNKGFSADGSELSGAIYAERLGSELSIKVQAAGLAALKEGRYVLVFSAENREFCLDLGGGGAIKIADAPSIKDGFAALVAYVREEVHPVALGRCGSVVKDVPLLLNAITLKNKKKGEIPTPPPVEFPPAGPAVPDNVPPALPPNEPPNTPSFPIHGAPKGVPEEGEPFRERACAYNDEAIAESDYFGDSVQACDRNEDSAGKSERKGAKKSGRGNSAKDDGNINPVLFPKGKLTYYKKVRKAIEQAFEKFPPDTRLLAVFPRSEWVKTESALLGVIYENGQPRYLCVAAEKTGEAPEDMKEHCTFVPESPFSEDKGFYVVFQDADTGAYVDVSGT